MEVGPIGNSYNALGGVAVIIGQATGKLLHVGVRKKLCYICTRAESKQLDPKPHECFRNWSESSQSMESDIIVEGFKEAEKTHGIRYTRMIRDGDNSVFARVREDVPHWGRAVTKLECANHICKCLRSRLEKLVSDKPYYKGKNKLSKKTRVRITTAVRCAIRMRSAETDKQAAISKLRHDIVNCVKHVFNIHSGCSEDFCKAKSSVSDTQSSPPVQSSDVHVDDTVPSVLKDSESFWTDGTAEADMEESRSSSDLQPDFLDNDLLKDVLLLLRPIADKSESLIGNFTSNLAESRMWIRTKFDGGKVFNRCHRGSWHARCFGAALRKNLGPSWSHIVWERVTVTAPGSLFIKHYSERAHHLSVSQIIKRKPEIVARARKRKSKSFSTSSSKKAKRDYGESALEVCPDVSSEELAQLVSDYYEKELNITNDAISLIANNTQEQAACELWLRERKIRLTASNFKDVVCRKPTIPVAKLVERLIYSDFKGNVYTKHGLTQESIIIKEYLLNKKAAGEEVSVSKSGLIIDIKDKYLAASPDGIIKSKGQPNGILEVKCLLQRDQFTFEEATSNVKDFCLEMKDGLHLKKSHKYYYQCQGQMNVADMPWVDFVVRRTNPYEIHIERIYKDTDLWKNVMLPKLNAFYFKALLPELCSPRFGKVPGIREPGTWFVEPSSGKCQGRKKSQATKSKVSSPKLSTSAAAPDELVGTRSRRRRHVKFVGRRISHRWLLDEAGNTEWFTGSVLDVISGKDGDADAVYQILYETDNTTYDVDGLVADYMKSWVKFIDLS